MNLEENRPPQTAQERAAAFLRKPEDHLVRPRSTTPDIFEQNPVVREENLYSAPQDRVREAVRRVVEDHEPLAQVAKEMQLAPASVQRWKKQYFQMLNTEQREEKEKALGLREAPAFTELNHDAGLLDHRLGAHDIRRFSDNWDRLLDQTHASAEDFRQDPWDVWLQNSDWTGWLYDEDGKFERSSLLGFLFLILAVLSGYLMLMVDNRPAPTKAVVAPMKPAELLLLQDETNLEKSYDVVKEFLAQDTWIQRLRYVRDRDRVAPLIKAYYSKNPDRAITEVIPYAGILGTDQISVSAEIPELNEVHYFNVVVVPETAHSRTHLIDWESSTMFQRPNFQEFFKNQPRKPYRLWVKIRKEEYYNHQFSDPAVYSCYAMNFPGLPETIFGYIKTDSQAGLELKISTMRNEEPGIIIEAHYPEKIIDPLMVEISSLVATQWIPES